MKKFILMALVASATAIYQPAKAQVSVSLNIGKNSWYEPLAYNRPVIYRNYYAPAPRYVKVQRHNYYTNKKYYKQPRLVSRYYKAPSTRYYKVKNYHYKQGHKYSKQVRGRIGGRH